MPQEINLDEIIEDCAFVMHQDVKHISVGAAKMCIVEAVRQILELAANEAIMGGEHGRSINKRYILNCINFVK